MKKRKIIPYNAKLKPLAKALRNNSTKAEIILWLLLKNKQFYGYRFHRQKPLNNYIVDFYCYELKLVIEVDGYSHELESVFEKDAIREQVLNSFGLRVLRFSDTEVLHDMDNVIRTLELYVKEFKTN